MSLWAIRDEPVLRHLAEHPPRDNAIWTRSRSARASPELPVVTEREFHHSVLILGDAGYVANEDGQYDGGGGLRLHPLPGHRRRDGGARALADVRRARLASATGSAPRSARA